MPRKGKKRLTVDINENDYQEFKKIVEFKNTTISLLIKLFIKTEIQKQKNIDEELLKLQKRI